MRHLNLEMERLEQRIAPGGFWVGDLCNDSGGSKGGDSGSKGDGSRGQGSKSGTVVGGAVVLTFPRPEGQCFYYIPDGPVLPSDETAAEEVFASTIEAIDERRREDGVPVGHLRIEPRWERLPEFVRGFRPIPVLRDPYMEPRDTLCIDLTPPEDAILAGMRPKGRYNISVARRHGVIVVEDTTARGLEDFLAVYDATADRQGLRAKPRGYFEKLVGMPAAGGRVALYFAEYQGERVAAALVVTFGSRATYFYGGSLDSHRNVMAPYLLHFEIMRRAKARGHAWYDLWGVAPLSEPNHPWRDISVFKRKFGGVEVQLVPTLDLVYDDGAYGRYVRGC